MKRETRSYPVDQLSRARARKPGAKTLFDCENFSQTRIAELAAKTEMVRLSDVPCERSLEGQARSKDLVFNAVFGSASETVAA